MWPGPHGASRQFPRKRFHTARHGMRGTMAAGRASKAEEMAPRGERQGEALLVYPTPLPPDHLSENPALTSALS